MKVICAEMTKVISLFLNMKVVTSDYIDRSDFWKENSQSLRVRERMYVYRAAGMDSK